MIGDRPHPLACYSGQAAMPDRDKIGKTCRNCRHWMNSQGRKRRGPWLAEAPCEKWLDFTSRTDGPGVPHHAGACAYFEVNRNPPKVHKDDDDWTF